MAIVKACDACGKYYNEAEQDGQLIGVFNRIPKETKMVKFYADNRTPVSYPTRLDLCNECYTKVLNIVHPDSRENPPC